VRFWLFRNIIVCERIFFFLHFSRVDAHPIKPSHIRPILDCQMWCRQVHTVFHNAFYSVLSQQYSKYSERKVELDKEKVTKFDFIVCFAFC
jgi:hypothetical protein